MKYFLFSLLISFIFSKPRTLIFAIDGLSSLMFPVLSSSEPKNSSSSASNQTYPSISYLISQGSFVTARTVIEAVSAPGWTANFCSLDSSSTGIMLNSWTPRLEPINKTLPCLFETLSRVDEKLQTYFFFSWSWLGGLISNLTKARFCDNDELISSFLCDRLLTEEVLRLISNDDNWDVIVLYLNGVDESGHAFDWGSSQYRETVRLIDNHIGKVIELLQKKMIFSETTILLTSDHGGTMGKDHHGDPTDDNLNVPWVLVGPKIKKNHHLRGNVHNMDSMPTLFNAMGWKKMREWKGKVVEDAFEEGNN